MIVRNLLSMVIKPEPKYCCPGGKWFGQYGIPGFDKDTGACLEFGYLVYNDPGARYRYPKADLLPPQYKSCTPLKG